MTLGEFYKGDIVKMIGLGDAPEETKQAFLERSKKIIMANVAGVIEKKLPNEKRLEFFRLFDGSASDHERTEFLRENVPNIDEIVFRESLLFKVKAIAVAKNLKILPAF